MAVSNTFLYCFSLLLNDSDSVWRRILLKYDSTSEARNCRCLKPSWKQHVGDSLRYSSKLTCLSCRWKQRVWFGLDFYLSITSVQVKKKTKNKHLFRCADKPTERQQGYNTGVTNMAKDSFHSDMPGNKSFISRCLSIQGQVVRASCVPTPSLMPTDTSFFKMGI